MQSSSIRRQVKNIVNNYSEAEKKVREATSNDSWGPSSSLMSEIADLTYNVVAFSEIMSMIWRRLNDHGKNWRHVYKALTLLDYLIKTGSERVALQCRENIFAIQTLKDFQHIDRDGKDQGINVREKSKQLVVLLKDDERLKGERSQALKTKERMAQVATGLGSSNQISFGRGSSQPNLSTSYSEEYGKSGGSPASYHGSTSPHASSELEQARPQTSGEEELQLQLALAMSREAAEQEDRMRRGDDLRLQMALEESRKGAGPGTAVKKKKEPALMDLMDTVPEAPAAQASDPWGAAAPDPWQLPAPPVDPWGPSTSSAAPVKCAEPWGPSTGSAPVAQPVPDPWASGTDTCPKAPDTGNFDPFSTLNGNSKDDFLGFDSLRSSNTTGDARGSSTLPSRPSASASPDLMDLKLESPAQNGMGSSSRKTPESFLGPNAALVNLESLVSKPAQSASTSNPFLLAGAAPAPIAQINPFQVSQPQPPTLNQLRVSPMMGPSSQAFGSVEPLVLSMPHPGTIAMVQVPMPGMPALAPMGMMVPAMGVGIPAPVPIPQPLMSTGLPPAATTAQTGSTTNPFLL
ncbi:epsin-2-like [Anguilla anguilla]|uniref:epsin-2-like n=1 Tax=Anguilla anguilla TaxID=7936 RepID=UPI0015B22D26|nr:epsin-2-like [Anguilla anguilla]XP_035261034.1 epsin-2-like [Anguilla anguilla]